MILGYPITVYTDHAAVTNLFKGRNLSGRLSRWYLTIQEFSSTFKYLPSPASVVADSLSRNVPVGAVTNTSPEHEPCPVFQNFTIVDLPNAQLQHNVWSQVIYTLESGDESNLPKLSIPFSHFFLSQDEVFCRYWSKKKRTLWHNL